MGKMVTFRIFSLQHLVFSETFQSEIYLMFKQIFLFNAQLPLCVLMQLCGNFSGVKFAGATSILVTFRDVFQQFR